MSRQQGLFRTEVLDARRGSWLGTIHLATPLSRWLWTALGVALAATIVGFLVFGHYTRRERVPGQLIPSRGVLTLGADIPGTVSRVLVHQGSAVRQGQALVEVSGEQSSAALGNMHADISRQLRSQRARLQQNLATQRQLSESKKTTLSAQQVSLQAQQGKLLAQIKLQRQQVADARTLVRRFQPLLKKGYVSALQMQQQKVAASNAAAQLKALVRQQLALAQQIDSTRQQLAQVPLELSRQQNATRGKIDAIDQQLAQNEAARASIVRAPRDGVVSTLLARVGQQVTRGQALASVVPAGSRLQAQLLVPSRAVGFVQPGSSVVLRYEAYPYQKFGQQYGRVASISRSALSPSEVVALTGQAAKQPLYRVRVALDAQSIEAYGKAQALKPGMALSADILMDRRTLLEWVFEPLYGIGRDVQGGAAVNG